MLQAGAGEHRFRRQDIVGTGDFGQQHAGDRQMRGEAQIVVLPLRLGAVDAQDEFALAVAAGSERRAICVRAAALASGATESLRSKISASAGSVARFLVCACVGAGRKRTLRRGGDPFLPSTAIYCPPLSLRAERSNPVADQHLDCFVGAGRLLATRGGLHHELHRLLRRFRRGLLAGQVIARQQLRRSARR